MALLVLLAASARTGVVSAHLRFVPAHRPGGRIVAADARRLPRPRRRAEGSRRYGTPGRRLPRSTECRGSLGRIVEDEWSTRAARPRRTRRQRSARLRPFDAAETTSYVEERLRLAGHTGKALFDRSALRAVYEASDGIPRLVNIVCDGALLLGFARGKASIGAAEVREVARDLDLVGSGGAEAVEAAETREPGPRRSRWTRWIRPRHAGGV